MAGWCTIKPVIDTAIDLSKYPDVCTVGKQLTERERLQALCKMCGTECAVDDYSVQWSFINASTFGFVLTEKATGKIISWSVMKDFPKETAQAAFERDFSEATLRYNKGVLRAVEDFLEAVRDLNPTANYKLECTDNGYRIYRPLSSAIGVVPFEMAVTKVMGKVPEESVIHPDLWNVVGSIEGEAGRSIARLVTRYMKIGVVFDKIEYFKDGDYRRTNIVGYRKRDDNSLHIVTLTNRHIDLTDPSVLTYHDYYTK